MSLDFVIIPSMYNYQRYAFEVKHELKQITNKKINVEVDMDYSKLFTSRLSKWKKLKCNIVTIGDGLKDGKFIIVNFYSKGSNPNAMYLEDFIDLIDSFEIEPEEEFKEIKEEKEFKEEEIKDFKEEKKELPALQNPDDIQPSKCIIQ
jgi:hypothetical protein